MRVYGNSHGFLAGYPSTSHSVSCVLLAQEGDDMQRDYWYSAARDAARARDLGAIGRRAGERAVARLGARKLSTRTRTGAVRAGTRARILRAPRRGGARFAASTASRRSCWTPPASRCCPSFVQMQERPHLPRALASSPVRRRGRRHARPRAGQDGVLQGYVLGSYSARKLGLQDHRQCGRHPQPAGRPAAADAPDFEALAAPRMGTGLYVTELMGQGVNGVTGDYSRGASGFWVENGAISYPVHEITIAGNLKQMYRDVRRHRQRRRRARRHPHRLVLVDGITIAGS